MTACDPPPGTVGEWLRFAATPMERRNFEELLQVPTFLMMW
jgi:hypothetical protein